MTLTSWLGWASVDGRTSRALFAPTPNNHSPFLFAQDSLPTIAPACVSPLSFIPGLRSVVATALAQESCYALPTDIRSLPTRIAQRPQPLGTNYFRQASSALSSVSYRNRLVLRDPSAPARHPSHYQHPYKPDRLVLGRCITALPFSRHEPDPVLLRRRPFARLASTRPVTQPPQWHLYRNTTSYDPYQRPFLPKFISRHGLHPCIRRFKGLDGCQQPQ